MGNLLPTLLCAPLLFGGLMLYNPARGLTGPSLWLLLAFPVVGWVAVNYLGLFGNAAMRGVLGRRLDRFEPGAKDLVFVGYARPEFGSALDPHEDLGFLIFEEGRLRFEGELHQLSLDRDEISEFTLRSNIHSLLFLGGWVSVEYVEHLRPTRWLLEPREKPTLLANRRYRRVLLQKLRDWHRASAPPSDLKIALPPNESKGPGE